MALVDIPGGGVIWPTALAVAGQFGSFGQTTINGATQYFYTIGDVWWPDATQSTKTITHVHFRTGSQTINAASQFRVSLQDVNLSNTVLPARPDLVVDQKYVYPAGTGPSSGWNRVALSTTRQVTRGNSQIAVVFDWEVFVASSSVSLFFAQATANDGRSARHFSYWYNGSNFQAVTSNNSVVFEFSDGTYGFFAGTRIGATASETLSPSSNKQVALKFVAPATLRIEGLVLCLYPNQSNLNSVIEVQLIENTTVLKTLTMDAGSLADFNVESRHRYLFDSAVQLTKDQTYYIAVRAITDSFTLGLFEFPYGAWRTLGLIASGSKVQRASPFTGAWTNESLTSVPMVGVLLSGIDDGAGTSISGSRNIAGTVTYNGSPVSGATVRLIRQTDNATASTITNAQGQYSFSVAEGYLYHAVAEWTNSGQRYNAKSVWDLTPVA